MCVLTINHIKADVDIAMSGDAVSNGQQYNHQADMSPQTIERMYIAHESLTVAKFEIQESDYLSTCRFL